MEFFQGFFCPQSLFGLAGVPVGNHQGVVHRFALGQELSCLLQQCDAFRKPLFVESQLAQRQKRFAKLGIQRQCPLVVLFRLFGLLLR